MVRYTRAMERNEISAHEVAVWTVLVNASTWLTSAEIAEQASVAPRTARAHALKLVRANLVDQAELFPGHRYRIAPSAAQRNRGYYDRLTRATEIFAGRSL